MNANVVGAMRLARIALGCLPIKNVTILGLFDIAFNFIKEVISTTSYYRGAYAMFKITPGSLVLNSPLLAKSGSNYSFPGYPISLKWVKIKLRNTTTNLERSGRWCAVFIPYREIHDDKHYPDAIKEMTFLEASAMPYAKVSDARHDITVYFRMKDRTMYCAQPRELSEPIGVVLVFWDVGSRNNYNTEPANSSFNCELELNSLCLPHAIFGPQHRVEYKPDVFKIPNLTSGDTLVIDRVSGKRWLESQADFEML